jgi:hypothetical protein
VRSTYQERALAPHLYVEHERPAGRSSGQLQTLQARVTGEYDAHCSLIASIFNGVVLFAAAGSLLAILASRESAGPRTAAVGLWLATLAGLVAVYNGYLVDAILISEPPNAVDVVVPFLSGTIEFTQFAVLVPLASNGRGAPPSPAAQLEHLTWWFLCASVLTSAGVVTQLNVRRHITRTLERAPSDLAPLVRWCARESRKGLVAAVVMTATTLAVFLLMGPGLPQLWLLDRLPAPAALRHWQGLLGLTFFAGAVNAVVLEDRGRAFIAASVSPNSEPDR